MLHNRNSVIPCSIYVELHYIGLDKFLLCLMLLTLFSVNKHHLDVTISKANSILSLVKRYAKEFYDHYVLKTLYCSLVRSILEYASVVWMPYFQVDIDRVESVQKQFLLFCLRNLGWRDRFQLPPYRQRLLLLNMLPLRDRQVMQCCVFIHNIGSGRIRAKKLREGLRARTVPYELRATRHFEFPIHRTIYELHEPINR